MKRMIAVLALSIGFVTYAEAPADAKATKVAKNSTGKKAAPKKVEKKKPVKKAADEAGGAPDAPATAEGN